MQTNKISLGTVINIIVGIYTAVWAVLISILAFAIMGIHGEGAVPPLYLFLFGIFPLLGPIAFFWAKNAKQSRLKDILKIAGASFTILFFIFLVIATQRENLFYLIVAIIPFMGPALYYAGKRGNKTNYALTSIGLILIIIFLLILNWAVINIQ